MQSRIVKPVVVGLAAAGAATALVAGAGAASATTPKTCDVTPWVSDVQGRPAGLTAHSKGGVYLWHVRDGFHLRVTHRAGDKRVYAGSITSPTRFVGVNRIRKEKQDKVWLSGDRKTLYFRFVNHGKIDGVNFRTACATSVTVNDLTVGAKALPVARVYLGKDRSHPAAVPFTVYRQS